MAIDVTPLSLGRETIGDLPTNNPTLVIRIRRGVEQEEVLARFVWRGRATADEIG